MSLMHYEQFLLQCSTFESKYPWLLFQASLNVHDERSPANVIKQNTLQF